MIQEYNVRVEIRNRLAEEANKVLDQLNHAASQAAADRLKAVHDKLIELLRAQEGELNAINAEITSLATEL